MPGERGCVKWGRKWEIKLYLFITRIYLCVFSVTGLGADCGYDNHEPPVPKMALWDQGTSH